MPFIPCYTTRKLLNRIESKLLELLKFIGIEGNLNYFLFKLCKDTCHSYKEFKDFKGELRECLDAINEFLYYPYEREKQKENGDVE